MRTCKGVSKLIHSFIHSFISNIYIAPLQEKLLRGSANSSAAKKNERDEVLGKRRSSGGRPFQVEGPTTEKARFCLMEVWAKRTRRRFFPIDIQGIWNYSRHILTWWTWWCMTTRASDSHFDDRYVYNICNLQEATCRSPKCGLSRLTILLIIS